MINAWYKVLFIACCIFQREEIWDCSHSLRQRSHLWIRCSEITIYVTNNTISVQYLLNLEGLNSCICKKSHCTHASYGVDKARQQLAALSRLLQFDKYNFKRSSQTASAGRLHNEHNNSLPHGSSSLVHLPLQMLPCLYVHMCLCFTASLSEAPHLLLPTKRMYRGTFWTSIFFRGNAPLPFLSSVCPLTCNAWLTTAPLKEVKGQTKQSGVMATCVPPTSIGRGGNEGAQRAVT